MISRYDIKVISQIWSHQKKYLFFLKVEQALIKALEYFDIIPKGISKELESTVINEERIDELDKQLKHDVIAFCTSITEQMSDSSKAYFHYGVTSSDIIDTALMLQMKESVGHILIVLEKVVKALQNQVEKSQEILCLGRSHGIYAEPMIMGQKWLNHLCEFARRYQAIKDFRFTGQFSGAVGNYSVLTPEVEQKALNELNLDTEVCSTQVIPRDRIAELVNEFSLLGCAIERLAIEIRHLHHSDINEVCEGFSKGQKGSSTMPHKKNPISSENLSGLSRMLKSYSQIAYENCSLWHERDISHSSAERMYLPDMFGVSYYALERLEQTLNHLEYNIESIESKVIKNPQTLSSLILHNLIQKTSLNREQLYLIVQKACFEFKSLDEIHNFIHQEVGVDLDLQSLEQLRSHYKKQFLKVYKRVQIQYSELF